MARGAFSLALVVGLAASAAACPFCTAVKPSLSQRIEESVQAALVEVASDSAKGESAKSGSAKGESADEVRFTVRQPLGGAEPLIAGRELVIATRDISGASKPGQLALLLATRDGQTQKLAWEVVPLDEVGFAYVARAPSRRLPAVKRLAYFAKFLENANPTVAEDAYLEFGAAPYDDVAQVAERLPMASMRRWIEDPRVPESRKGFYGLALGLAKTDAERRANRDVLARLVDAPADDFRAGFDGVLGGYLMLAGTTGLAHVERRLFANPQARAGDVRHAATALRFVHEFGAAVIPPADITRATRRLLARPELAAAAIVDLARWEDWESLAAVAALFDEKAFADAATSRAIVGYLSVCPRPAAAETLARFRRQDPRRVAAAEEAGLLTPARQ